MSFGLRSLSKQQRNINYGHIFNKALFTCYAKHIVFHITRKLHSVMGPFQKFFVIRFILPCPVFPRHSFNVDTPSNVTADLYQFCVESHIKIIIAYLSDRCCSRQSGCRLRRHHHTGGEGERRCQWLINESLPFLFRTQRSCYDATYLQLFNTCAQHWEEIYRLNYLLSDRFVSHAVVTMGLGYIMAMNVSDDCYYS